MAVSNVGHCLLAPLGSPVGGDRRPVQVLNRVCAKQASWSTPSAHNLTALFRSEALGAVYHSNTRLRLNQRPQPRQERWFSRRVFSFFVEESILIKRRAEEVLECILDLPGAVHYNPGTSKVDLLTPDIPPYQEGVTYKVQGFVWPLRPLVRDFKVNGIVYNKLLKYDADGSQSDGHPTIMREMKTTQGNGIETWSLTKVDEGTLVKYTYNSTGFEDVPDADTTWEQNLFARFNLFKYFDSLLGGMFKELIVESLAARKEYIENKASAISADAKS